MFVVINPHNLSPGFEPYYLDMAQSGLQGVAFRKRSMMQRFRVFLADLLDTQEAFQIIYRRLAFGLLPCRLQQLPQRLDPAAY